jgi:hypothetical protein
MIIPQLAEALIIAPLIVMIVSSCAAISIKSRRFALWGAMVGALSAAFGSSLVMSWSKNFSLCHAAVRILHLPCGIGDSPC